MKPHVSLFLAAGLTLCVAGCIGNKNDDTGAPATIAPVQTGPSKQPSEGYTLRPTDVLHIEMYMEPDFKYDNIAVSAEGDIELPLIERTHVAGKSLKEVRLMLAEKYKKYFQDPNISIQITRYSERKVYIDGFVGRPGAVIFPPEENMTISRAIAGASGIQARGERSDVKITRSVNGKIQVFTIDMDEVSSGRVPDMELQENDRVYVRDSHI